MTTEQKHKRIANLLHARFGFVDRQSTRYSLDVATYDNLVKSKHCKSRYELTITDKYSLIYFFFL
jgi:hypothetical protein